MATTTDVLKEEESETLVKVAQQPIVPPSKTMNTIVALINLAWNGIILGVGASVILGPKFSEMDSFWVIMLIALEVWMVVDSFFQLVLLVGTLIGGMTLVKAWRWYMIFQLALKALIVLLLLVMTIGMVFIRLIHGEWREAVQLFMDLFAKISVPLVSGVLSILYLSVVNYPKIVVI